MKRILTTLTLGIGLTAGTVFAASAAPSQIITPSATTAGTTRTATPSTATPSTPSNSRRSGGGSGGSGGGSGSSGRSSRNSAASSSAGTWVKDAKGWWLNYGAGNYAKNTWVNKDSKWYYFDAEGYMLTSWRFINNNLQRTLVSGTTSIAQVLCGTMQQLLTDTM